MGTSSDGALTSAGPEASVPRPLGIRVILLLLNRSRVYDLVMNIAICHRGEVLVWLAVTAVPIVGAQPAIGELL